VHALIERLLAEAPAVTDGAWGTLFQAQGLAPGACPDEWNLRRPDSVLRVARTYVESGSRIVLTNTFGANRIALEKYGLASEAEAINRAGARLSKQGAGNQALVFASIGPTGKLLMIGEVTSDAVRDAFAEQARALAAGGADGIVIETMTDLGEANLAVQAARATGLPVVACMSFDSGAAGMHTMMGVSAEQAARALTEACADVIGANCGRGVESMAALCRAFRAASPLPIWIKANAGLPRLERGRTVYDMTPEAFAAHVPELVEAGATFIGGCCGTDPSFISQVSRACAAVRLATPA
jgi:methionine synthase I (cobalamin-dependent)